MNGGYTKTTGYWAGRDWSISANASASYQLPAWEHFAIQLSGFVAYFNTAYHQADADGTIGNLAWQTKLSAVISY